MATSLQSLGSKRALSKNLLLQEVITILYTLWIILIVNTIIYILCFKQISCIYSQSEYSFQKYFSEQVMKPDILLLEKNLYGLSKLVFDKVIQLILYPSYPIYTSELSLLADPCLNFPSVFWKASLPPRPRWLPV